MYVARCSVSDSSCIVPWVTFIAFSLLPLSLLAFVIVSSDPDFPAGAFFDASVLFGILAVCFVGCFKAGEPFFFLLLGSIVVEAKIAVRVLDWELRSCCAFDGLPGGRFLPAWAVVIAECVALSPWPINWGGSLYFSPMGFRSRFIAFTKVNKQFNTSYTIYRSWLVLYIGSVAKILILILSEAFPLLESS